MKTKVGNACLAGSHMLRTQLLLTALYLWSIFGFPSPQEEKDFLSCELLSIYIADFCRLMGPFAYPEQGPEMCLPVVKALGCLYSVWSCFVCVCDSMLTANSSSLESRQLYPRELTRLSKSMRLLWLFSFMNKAKDILPQCLFRSIWIKTDGICTPGPR